MDLADALRIANQAGRPGAEVVVGTVVQLHSNMTVGVDLGEGGIIGADDGMVYPTVPRLRSYSPIEGDTALILRAGGSLYCVGALNATPVPDPTPVPDRPPKPRPKPPPPKPVTRKKSFRPTSTGSYRNGSWRGDTSDLYQRDWTGRGDNYGAAFYGNGPSSLRGAAVRGRLRMRRLSGAGSAAPVRPRMRLLSQRRKSGAPNEIGAVMGPALRFGQSTTWTLPTAWVTRLINGDAGGIGIGDGGDYMGLMGPARWSPAMTLELTWRR